MTVVSNFLWFLVHLPKIIFSISEFRPRRKTKIIRSSMPVAVSSYYNPLSLMLSNHHQLQQSSMSQMTQAQCSNHQPPQPDSTVPEEDNSDLSMHSNRYRWNLNVELTRIGIISSNDPHSNLKGYWANFYIFRTRVCL